MGAKTGKVLVIGAGISGIRASLDLADLGYRVTLIDRASHPGGMLSRLDAQFPSNGCGMCRMLPMVNRDAASQACLRRGLFHENIDLRLSTRVETIDGEAGAFQVVLRQDAQLVNPDVCNGCGLCEAVCPVVVPEAFNSGLSSRKAIGLPIPHSYPNQYVIDPAVCNRCGACESVCPTGAIQLAAKDREQFRILVVDDELIVRDSIKEWLAEEGFTVDMAASGPEALEKLAAVPYDMMLLDIKMPQMDGVTVLERARDIVPDVSVVMMTAYATVETAVSAMKIGAVDYLLKPFDPEDLVAKVVGMFDRLSASRNDPLTFGAILVCSGADYFDPAAGRNLFGYGVSPNVVTNLTFERILSGSGPFQGGLLRPSDGKPARKIAWIQCVGSRDVQSNADFCSGICCMIALKEALLARKSGGKDLEAAIFYMDMRTCGKSYQRYHDQVESTPGIRLVRGRIHSLEEIPESRDLKVRYVDVAGDIHEEVFHLVVLSVGRRPAAENKRIMEKLELTENIWGFPATDPFLPTHTEKQGVFFGGTVSGPRDISESVIHAGSAALSASRVMHKAGGGLQPVDAVAPAAREVMGDPPEALVIVCTCRGKLLPAADQERLSTSLRRDPAVRQIVYVDRLCTATGWENAVDAASGNTANRILIGSCMPQVPAIQLQQLAQAAALDARLVEAVPFSVNWDALRSADDNAPAVPPTIHGTLGAGIAYLKYRGGASSNAVPVYQKALVVGGGIAGLTAALAIADHGYPVDVVEQADHFGGNLVWLRHTLEGHSTREFLEDVLTRSEQHPQIRLFSQSRVIRAEGEVGRFSAAIEDAEGTITTGEYGTLIFATGGEEAATTSYGYGTSPCIVTQKELARQLDENTLQPDSLSSVVMIQCVDSREEPRNYCSRICCTTAVKHALRLKKEKPEISIYVLYRDMMTCGFTESWYTEARKQGVIFIQYSPDRRPEVVVPQNTEEGVRVRVFEPILGQSIEIESDLIVLATGVQPRVPVDLVRQLGMDLDRDGFFQEAESKWRPVDSLKEGVYGCGLGRAPCSIAEAVSSAEAAAQRALVILSRKELSAGIRTAEVRHSLCTLCRQCVSACPYGARTIDWEQEKIQINAAVCQGCGACAAACPNGASVLAGLPVPQIFEMIDAAVEEL